MRGVVGAVAAVHLVVNRYGAVGTQAQAKYPLLQVGTMVLAVSAFELHVAGRLIRVVAIGLDRGTVVVQPREVEFEQRYDRDYQLGHQRGTIGAIQPVQRTRKAIVAEALLR